GVDPPRLVRRDPASGYDAMQVRVMQEILPPGVQNAEEADGGAEMFGIGGDPQQGIRTGLEQPTVDLLLVLQGEGGHPAGGRTRRGSSPPAVLRFGAWQPT